MRRDDEPSRGQHSELIEARKSCRKCMERNSGKIHSGASFDFDPYVVSYWSQWLGHPRPQILVIGQDFGDVGYFERNRGADEDGNDTNENLFKLLEHIGLKPRKPPQEDRETRVFLTNSILCLKEPPMNSKVRRPWVYSCAITHLRPLIQKLAPPVIVGMGGPGWLAARLALAIEDAPEKITVAAGGMWTTKTGIQVFAVGHCGPLGIANRSWRKQLEDWSRVGEARRQVAESSN